jgi:hypothetical protein
MRERGAERVGGGGGYLLWFTVLLFGCSEGRLILFRVQNDATPLLPSLCSGRLDFGTCLAISESRILLTISNTYIQASWYQHVGGSRTGGERIAYLGDATKGCISLRNGEGRTMYVDGEYIHDGLPLEEAVCRGDGGHSAGFRDASMYIQQGMAAQSMQESRTKTAMTSKNLPFPGVRLRTSGTQHVVFIITQHKNTTIRQDMRPRASAPLTALERGQGCHEVSRPLG